MARPHALLQMQAALLQPNIDQYKKWTAQYEDEIAATLQTQGASLSGKQVYCPLSLRKWSIKIIDYNTNRTKTELLLTHIEKSLVFEKSKRYNDYGKNFYLAPD